MKPKATIWVHETRVGGHHLRDEFVLLHPGCDEIYRDNLLNLDDRLTPADPQNAPATRKHGAKCSFCKEGIPPQDIA